MYTGRTANDHEYIVWEVQTEQVNNLSIKLLRVLG